MLVVQYLEDGPDVATIAPAEARARLRDAFERLPISAVLLGWHLPQPLLRACADETARAGASLFRWHPLLTGDATFPPRPEWRTVGLTGEHVPGFHGLPEFTFLCPNRPAAREAALEHLHDALRRGEYDGVFLDRIRYPSPAGDPARWLACFCDGCRRAAAGEGFDLKATQRQIVALLGEPVRAQAAVRVLLDALAPTPDADLAALHAFLDFRARSVTRFVQAAADVARAQGLAVGLDCFAPALTYMVGQDLAALNSCCDWIKVMVYGHTFGPAGLPFELLALADWPVGRRWASEPQALAWLTEALRLPLPPSRAALLEDGLSPGALAAEVRRARAAGVGVLLAGIELVDVAGVTRLASQQIAADLRAFRAAGADGLALSWDLWHIPRGRLDLVGREWPAPAQ
jgi:hypothetical protein